MALIKHEFLPKPSIENQALLELTIAGILWGFGFIGTVWALAFLSPSAIIFYRFAIAFVAGSVFLFLLRNSLKSLLSDFALSLIPAVFLWATLFFQTWGLEYTTATNSSFITTLYVVFVPLVRALMKQEKFQWKHWFCVAMALLGTAFIVQIHKISQLNWGDLLTFICSWFAVFHILTVDQRALKTTSPFAFNTFQSFWVAFFALLAFPFSSKWSLAGMNSDAWLGLLSLGFGSSMVAFFLQVRSQRKIPPSVVSLLFLIESPVSYFFAFLLLGERMDASQVFGALLILIACVIIVVSKRADPHHYSTT